MSAVPKLHESKTLDLGDDWNDKEIAVSYYSSPIKIAMARQKIEQRIKSPRKVSGPPLKFYREDCEVSAREIWQHVSGAIACPESDIILLLLGPTPENLNVPSFLEVSPSGVLKEFLIQSHNRIDYGSYTFG